MPHPFLVALGFRSLSLLLPHTFFQPDEFYQAFEPGYAAVFGEGYLTWEWRDLPSLGPAAGSGLGRWWDEVVVRGRLRGYIWPGVFALVYGLIQRLGIDSGESITFAPRVVGVVLAAATDYYTAALAGKILGRRSGCTALFLSLTSLFNAHLLPRALSTSPETLLTVAAVYYYPIGGEATERNAESAAVVPVAGEKAKDNAEEKGASKAVGASSSNGASANPEINAAFNHNYSLMDRVDDEHSDTTSSLVLAAGLAALSICIRPTMLVFWGYLSLEQGVAEWRRRGVTGVLSLFVQTLVGGITVLIASTAIDYYMIGRLTLPLLSFFHRNVVMNIASFYGATGLLYHVTQSLPILLLPIWYWWAKGYAAALLPSTMLPASLAALDRPERLRTLARAVSFTLATLSLSPHSEWRFAHPLLPLLLLFAIPALQAAYAPPMVGCHHPMRAFRQYFRLPRGAFYTILLVPLLPYLYLNTFHGAAQVSVMSSLRRGEFGAVDTLAVLMPCHSTPWASHLGSVARDSWFLTCEPPLARDGEDDNEKAEKFQHVTQQDLFYTSPVSYITTVFPYAPNPLGRAAVSAQAPDLPSHVLLFGCVLDHVEDGVRFADALGERGYVQVAALWNGFDVLQDEEKRRGGVRVWRRERAGRERDGNSW